MITIFNVKGVHKICSLWTLGDWSSVACALTPSLSLHTCRVSNLKHNSVYVPLQVKINVRHLGAHTN